MTLERRTNPRNKNFKSFFDRLNCIQQIAVLLACGYMYVVSLQTTNNLVNLFCLENVIVITQISQMYILRSLLVGIVHLCIYSKLQLYTCVKGLELYQLKHCTPLNINIVHLRAIHTCSSATEHAIEHWCRHHRILAYETIHHAYL